MPIKTPTISLNGSPADRLMENTRNAQDALRKAQEALSAVYPNARDYQGWDEFYVAQKEHEARAAAVQQILRDLSELAIAISDQQDARRR